ncbi:MAG: Lrp/AsnC family transcriptional regulator [Chloroflexi bacterium]|nr:Lrp/AsnC family transcriptional regulator [Chloroflexota bacterium]
MELDLIEKQLLNEIQRGMPLTGRPFRDLGYKLSLDEDELIRRVLYLKESGILRWLGAVIDWRKLGFQSALIAMKIPAERIETAAEAINKHHGVSHNYSRSHDFNLWFTLALPPTAEMCTTVQELSQQAGASDTLSLPATRVFKIRAFFDVLGNGSSNGNGAGAEDAPNFVQEDLSLTQTYKPSIIDFGILKELQGDLPIKRRPFDQMARRMDIYLDDFLLKSKELMDRGVIRRFSGLVHHGKAGYTVNVMSCWSVPQEKIEALGSEVAHFKNITHCYERPCSHTAWPYNVYTMIHGHTREECEGTAQTLSSRLGLPQYAMLYTMKEYKKERISWLG